MGMKSRREPKRIDESVPATTEPIAIHSPEIDTTGMVDYSNAGGIETTCPDREDGQHCRCWYDNEPCCACGDNGEGLDV